MAMKSTNNVNRSRNRRRADRSSPSLRFGLVSTYCCLVLTSVHQSSQIPSCEAFSPLFTASKPSKNLVTISKTLSSGSGRTILSMAPKNKKSKKDKKGKIKEEDRRRWLSWMTTGTLSKTRHADEIRMREAEELGGVARSDRYSSG